MKKDMKYNAAGPFIGVAINPEGYVRGSDAPEVCAPHFMNDWAENIKKKYSDRLDLSNVNGQFSSASQKSLVSYALIHLGPDAVAECIPSYARRKDFVDYAAKTDVFGGLRSDVVLPMIAHVAERSLSLNHESLQGARFYRAPALAA